MSILSKLRGKPAAPPEPTIADLFTEAAVLEGYARDQIRYVIDDLDEACRKFNLVDELAGEHIESLANIADAAARSAREVLDLHDALEDVTA